MMGVCLMYVSLMQLLVLKGHLICVDLKIEVS